MQQIGLQHGCVTITHFNVIKIRVSQGDDTLKCNSDTQSHS